MITLAIIPARSGSKSIAHKNIATFHGKPMIAHSIEQAKMAESVNRVIVSTDSAMYADIARYYGAEVPFLRPAELSGHLSTDLVVFQHALEWLREKEHYCPEICVHLRPTYPTRRVREIDQAVALLKESPDIDSVRSVIEAPLTPYKMWRVDDADGLLRPVLSCQGINEPYNEPRQRLPKTYLQTANVDAIWTKTITEKRSMSGHTIKPMFTETFNDIDEASDLAQAAVNAEVEMRGKRFVFDIDGIIATIAPDNDYPRARPIPTTVDLINKLYELGNHIILFTARGYTTGIDWRSTTAQQMDKWGVRYHELHFGKPAGDYYIDDRMIHLSALRNLVKHSTETPTPGNSNGLQL